MDAGPEPATARPPQPDPGRASRPLPVWRIGIGGGLVGIACCVGPTVLAIVGAISGATAYSVATDLYDGYAWWFRLAGLAVLVATVWIGLRRRRACTVTGVCALRRRLVMVLVVAVATYAALYALTTWLGRFA